MALGTALSAAVDVSTTAGVHTFSLNAAGLTAVNNALGSGIITVCLMGYHYDYGNNAPTQDGDHTQIRVYYVEAGGSQRPSLSIDDGGIVETHIAEGSGDADDCFVSHNTTDGSVSWDTIRGDVDTSGTLFSSSFSNHFSGVYGRIITGRGSDVLTQCTRSYFTFYLGGSSLTADSATIGLYLDNYGHTNDDLGKVIIVEATELAGSTADFGNCFAPAVSVTHNATFFGANF